MSRFSRRSAALGAGAVVVAVVAVVAQLTAPSGAVPSPEVVPGLAAAGGATVGTTKSPKALGTLEGSARSLAATTGPKSIAVVGSAVGGRAPGFAMDLWTTSDSRARNGLSGATCSEPDDDLWFVGTASTVGRTSTLYLTDTEATPATVDIALYGKNGRIDAPGGLGLVVKGNSRRVVHLDQLAPG